MQVYVHYMSVLPGKLQISSDPFKILIVCLTHSSYFDKDFIKEDCKFFKNVRL